jgi:HSP20 family protein
LIVIKFVAGALHNHCVARRNGDVPADIRIDVAEDEKNFIVKADVPGVSKDDIHVAIDGNQVSITAETKIEKEEKGKNTLRRERYYGKQYRSFVLSAEIDDSKAQANYKDGVLHLTLPKKAGTAARLALNSAVDHAVLIVFVRSGQFAAHILADQQRSRIRDLLFDLRMLC